MKKTFFIMMLIALNLPLSAYFLGQKVPLDFNYNYWNKNNNFLTYQDIRDDYLCSPSLMDKCNCTFVGVPTCIEIVDTNTTININDELKKEKFDSLTIVDINDTFPELDSFVGYDQNQNAVDSVGSHPVNTSQGYYIYFDSNAARMATEQETIDTDDFRHGLSNPETLDDDAGAVVTDFNENNYTQEYQDNYDYNITDGYSNDDTNLSTASNIADKSNYDSDEMNQIQTIINNMGKNLYTVTDGSHTFMTGNVGGIEFDELTNDFLSNYVGEGLDSDKLLGQLGLTGSVNCYTKKPKYHVETKFNANDTKLCVNINGILKKNDYSDLFSGGFGADKHGHPICDMKGIFTYNPSSGDCEGCNNPSAFWDKNNHVCKTCTNDETYDKELDKCIASEYITEELGEAEPQAKIYDYYWVGRCHKRSYTATIVYTGTEEHEPPGGLKCDVYNDVSIPTEDTVDYTYQPPLGNIPKCSNYYQAKCSWKPTSKVLGGYAEWAKVLNKSPYPYPDSSFVLDYRINNYTKSALWGKEERRTHWGYGLIYFYRQHNTAIPVKYNSKKITNTHGWTLLRSERPQQSSVFAKYKELEVQWDRGDEKYASSIKFNGTDINERMFVCKGNKFLWWSNNTVQTGKSVSMYNINTCEQEPQGGWNSAFDLEHIQDYVSEYSMGNILDVGTNKVRFGIYSKEFDGIHNADTYGNAVATYRYKPRHEPIKSPIIKAPVRWEAGSVAIGCDIKLSKPKIPDVCLTFKSSADIHAKPNEPNSPIIGKNVNMSPAQLIQSNYAEATAELSGQSMSREDDNETYYPSGVSISTLNNASDINNIFKSKDTLNSPIAITMADGDSESLEIIKSYMKTKQGGKNSNFIGTPNSIVTTNALVSIRVDYLGLPSTLNDVAESVAALSKTLSEDYNILNFMQNSLIFLNSQFQEIEAIPTIKTVADVKMTEQQIYKTFIESNSTTEAKALIEKRNAEKYIAVKTVTRGDRIAVPTLQRLPSLSKSERLHYIATSSKQMTKDGYITSVFSRIGKFKEEVFDMAMETSRINAKPSYNKVMADSLADAVKWSKDKIR